MRKVLEMRWGKVLSIAPHERGQLVMVQDGGDVEEEVALFLVLEAVLAAEPANAAKEIDEAEGRDRTNGIGNLWTL